MKIHTLSLSLVKEKSLLLKISFTAVFLSIIVLLTFFILHTSEITEQFYLTRAAQKTITELSQENRALKADLLSSNFSKNTEILAQENYEEVGKIHYVRILSDTAIAKNIQQ